MDTRFTENDIETIYWALGFLLEELERDRPWDCPDEISEVKRVLAVTRRIASEMDS